ncbi:SNW domain-containing protein 1 [Aphanomyces cochlioides]|nr:SNW domain-containing protein 1 [Aphanomyces cochlioides]
MGFSFLPAPTRQYEAPTVSKPRPAVPQLVKKAPSAIPSYPNRRTATFTPRDAADFGDGGAYPEIHMSQYPLGLGKKGSNASSESNVLALQVNESGRAAYDAIVKKKNQIVYSSFTDLVEKDANDLEKPSVEEEQEATEKTRAALEALISGKIAAAQPVNVTRQKSVKETSTYIRYTPHDQGTNANGEEPKQRIIRMVEAPVDPMQPAKFKHKKAVRGPPSPPVPVMHSPPRKLTVQDQQSWKIPPCVSNWKNAKGYTIALDKRLAADGRGLLKVTVNDQFASFAEALAIAERKAREEVNMRIQVQKKLDAKQKEVKEQELRELAAKARQDRGSDSEDDSEDDGDIEGRRERERIRHERRREREREMRLENLMGKKGKLARDEDRDVSEKIALGQLQGGKRSDASLFDSRLFNQSQGMDSGFGGEDDYNVYSKPMIDRGKSTVYRPKVDAATIDGDREYEDLKAGGTKRFRADKEFQGTDHTQTRTGPVQFTRENESPDRKPRRRSRSGSYDAPRRTNDRNRSRSRSRENKRTRDRSRSRSREPEKRRRRNDDDEDPFGVDRFLDDARHSSRRR